MLDDPALFARKNNQNIEINKIEDDNNNNNIDDKNINTDENNDDDNDGDKKKKSKKSKKNDKQDSENKTEITDNTGIRACPDKLHLGLEYLELAEKYPVKMKSVIFHIRRICRDEFTDFQLMEDCVGSKTISELKEIINIAIKYKLNNNFIYDKNKEKKAKEIYEKRKREEGKRKEYEARMVRKAKRENKNDLHFYLSQGSENPSIEKLTELKKLPKEIGFEIWKKNYAQHCYNFHFEVIGCHRDRTCSFLHHDTTFADETAVAYG